MQALNIHVEQIATAAIQNREQFGSLQGSEECNQSESSFYKKLQEMQCIYANLQLQKCYF